MDETRLVVRSTGPRTGYGRVRVTALYQMKSADKHVQTINRSNQLAYSGIPEVRYAEINKSTQ